MHIPVLPASSVPVHVTSVSCELNDDPDGGLHSMVTELASWYVGGDHWFTLTRVKKLFGQVNTGSVLSVENERKTISGRRLQTQMGGSMITLHGVILTWVNDIRDDIV